MPDFPAYGRDELVERARNLIRTRRRGADVSEGSDYDLWARILGLLAWAQQKHATAARLLIDPRRAFGGYLEAYASELGVGRDLTETSTRATRAHGKVILLSETGEQTQPAGSLLRHADGTTYTLDADATTSAIEDKILYAGHRSGRRRLYQGHLGGGFREAFEGEVYRSTATGEYVALQAADNASALSRHLFDLYNDLDLDPEMHDAFVKQPGAVVRITASEPGARGNKDPKDTLTVVTPAGDVLSEAHILQLDGGADPMTPAALQRAIAEISAVRAPLGTLEEIRQLALSAPRVPLSECFVMPGTAGLGSYGLLPVRRDGAFVGALERAAILAHVAARLSPVDKVYGAATYEALDTRIDVVSVQLSEIYRPDWRLPDDTPYGVEVTEADANTLTLTAVSDLAPGDRLILTTRGTGGAYLVVRRVTDLVGLTVALDAPLPFPPDTANAYVTPGGALAEDLIEALYAAYDRRAPSAGDGGVRIRYPAAATSDEPEAIVRALSTVDGVLDVAFQAGATPDLHAPGGVLVPQCVLRMYV